MCTRVVFRNVFFFTCVVIVATITNTIRICLFPIQNYCQNTHQYVFFLFTTKVCVPCIFALSSAIDTVCRRVCTRSVRQIHDELTAYFMQYVW